MPLGNEVTAGSAGITTTPVPVGMRSCGSNLSPICRGPPATTNPHCRFPAFWGPNCDWVPDQDHGAVGMLAEQAMLAQEVDGTVQILPAGPKAWNVEFKLHAPGGFIVEAQFVKGSVVSARTTAPRAGIRECRRRA